MTDDSSAEGVGGASLPTTPCSSRDRSTKGCSRAARRWRKLSHRLVRRRRQQRSTLQQSEPPRKGDSGDHAERQYDPTTTQVRRGRRDSARMQKRSVQKPLLALMTIGLLGTIASEPTPTESGKLPACFKVKHKLLVKALREYLRIPLSERRITEPDGGVWNDAELVDVLDKFEETGGFPTDYFGPEDITFDTEANGHFRGDELEFVHAEMRKELAEGWCTMYRCREDIPWKHYRTSPMFTALKKKAGRPKKDKRGKIKRRLIDHLSYPRGASLNDFTEISIPIIFEDVRDAERKTMKLKEAGNTVWY